MQRRSTGTLALLIIPLSPIAWADTVEEAQGWFKITATGGLAFLHPRLKDFRFWLEGQARFANDTSTLKQGIVRPALGYAINDRASLWLGYAYVPTDPFTLTPFNEQRVWEQFLWTQATGPGKFSFRNRLEQRFRTTGATTGWRFRQMFAWSFPLKFAQGFSVELFDEYFFNINNTDWSINGFDQNRAYFGIGYHFTQHIATEIGYLNRYLPKTGADNVMEHILSLSVFLHY
jgi:hypothetical protein